MGVMINSIDPFLEKRRKDLEEIKKRIHNNEMRLGVTTPVDEIRKIDLETQILLQKERQLEMEMQDLLYSRCTHILWQDKFNPNDIRCPECGFSRLTVGQLISFEAFNRELAKISSSFVFSSDDYGSYKDFCLTFRDLKIYFGESTLEELVEILKSKSSPQEKYIQRILEHKPLTGTVVNFEK